LTKAPTSAPDLGLGERIAAIDIGTNTVLLTIAERVSSGGDLTERLKIVAERHAITRLGQGVDRLRTLQDAAISRTLSCLREYEDEMRRQRVARVACVGTSALRDAAGGEAFVSRASDLLGEPVQVVSGMREAELTFRGALSSLSGGTGARMSDDALVCAFDIGGGSTEIVLGTRAGLVKQAVSIDIGSVRLFERYGDLPFAHAASVVRASMPQPFSESSSMVLGIAGTMTSLWSLLYRAPFDERLAGKSPLASDSIARLASELHELPLDVRRVRLGIDEGRADVIPYGALIAAEVLRFLRADAAYATGRGVRYGLLLESLGESIV
jgi:exopolyphosphatase/guanosine-5'-triphosphate,3'-diphosphate pyrophosphatase